MVQNEENYYIIKDRKNQKQFPSKGYSAVHARNFKYTQTLFGNLTIVYLTHYNSLF